MSGNGLDMGINALSKVEIAVCRPCHANQQIFIKALTTP